MELRPLGATGPALSAVGLGCNNFGMKLSDGEAVAVVRAALHAGVTHFDTAESYGNGASESVLGRALGTDRSSVIVASKFARRPAGPLSSGDLARRVIDGCEGTLRRLRTDHVDLYYQHFPDQEAPVEELLDALGDLVTSGKVRHVALSNPDAAYVDAVAGSGTLPWCGVQTEWSLLARSAEPALVLAAERARWGVVPYFPLASGLLTGKYRRSQGFPDGSRLAALSWSQKVATEDNFTRVERLEAFAQERGRTLLELALGWLLSRPVVASVIAGATSPAQVHANVAASSWRLTADESAAVDVLLVPPEVSLASDG